jgi:hypothetical protein
LPLLAILILILSRLAFSCLSSPSYTQYPHHSLCKSEKFQNAPCLNETTLHYRPPLPTLPSHLSSCSVSILVTQHVLETHSHTSHPHTNAGVTLKRPRGASTSTSPSPTLRACLGLTSHGFQRLYPPLTWLSSSLSLPPSSLSPSSSRRFAFMYRSMYVM